MNIWLIYPYGSLPGEGSRPERPQMIADALTKAGHDVTWWCSVFDHRLKTFRSHTWKHIEVSPRFTIRLVPTTGYEKNISLKRIRSEEEFGRQLYAHARQFPAPDVIIVSEPALFTCKPILRIVSETKARLILDRLDLWPEMFHMVLPRPLEKLGRALFAPLYSRRRDLFQKAHAIVAASDFYLELARKLAPKLPPENTATVYFGVDVAELRAGMSTPAQLPFPLQGLHKRDNEVWALYASTLGSNYDLATVLQAAALLERKNAHTRVLIAGAGPLKDYVVSFIKDNGLTRTHYVGNLDASTMSYIFSLCDVGLSSYLKSSRVSMPIKAFHYFAAGLPVVNSLPGDLAKLLETHDAGLQYEAENAQSLADTLQVMVSDPDRREMMARNSFNLGNAFDSQIQYAKVVDLVERVCRN
jgi:glycosyltransferase involved in cell wall biosynthesis